MGRAAPIVGLTAAFVSGVALGLTGIHIGVTPLLLLLWLGPPARPSRRPVPGPILVLVALTGCFVGRVGGDLPASCIVPTSGTSAVLRGRFLAAPRSGSGPFVRADGCGVPTVVVPSASLPVRAASPLTLRGVWREGAHRPWFQAARLAPEPSFDARGVAALRWTVVGWRDSLVERLERLYGPQAPLVNALTLARREGLDPSVREVFASTGIAHLLAISGFHVGVIAGVALVLLRSIGTSRRAAGLGSAGLAWAYVALIGFPDAACRAALILALVALSNARGRPPSRWGALSASALLLLMVDPAKLYAPGFQLSFAGAAGLVAGSRPAAQVLRRIPGLGSWTTLRTAVAAGVAATLATLPIVAWHFDRVSLVGIPMTVLATPLVSVALPGALASIGLDFVSPALASFVAGGVSLLLDLLVALSETVARIPGAIAWTSKGTVVGGVLGVVVAVALARHPRVGARGRRSLMLVYGILGIVVWPLVLSVQDRGTLELYMIDVGQGDGVAVRTPGGRWILVDAGPPSGGMPSSSGSEPKDDPRSHPVVRALRGRGVLGLDRLILSHPDLDHIGGAEAVLEAFPVRGVIDPALPVGKSSYAELLAAAGARAVPWAAGRSGDSFEVDGVTFTILHPSGPLDPATDPNEASLVILLSWQGFRALLTGDAYADVEQALADQIGDVDVLKVGHHGSDTSSDSTFLAVIRPEVALISVGRRNRYGHPSRRVLARLEGGGARVYRTDRNGAVRVIVRPSGAFDVRPERLGRIDGTTPEPP